MHVILLMSVLWIGAEPSVSPREEAVHAIETAGGRIVTRTGADGRSATRVVYAGGDGDLVKLKHLPSLTDLVLEGEVTNDGLDSLAGLEQLKKLKLSFSDVSAVGLEKLARLKGLAWLEIHDPELKDSALAGFRGLRGLQRLEIGRSQITDDGLAHLKDLTNLEVLSFRGPLTGRGLKHLIAMAKLKSLTLTTDQLSLAELAPLQLLPQLRILNLEGGALHDEDLRQLPALPQIEYLDLDRGSHFTVEGLGRLRSFTNLRTLVARGPDPSKEDGEKLRRMLSKVRVVRYGLVENPLEPFTAPDITAYRICEEHTIGTGVPNRDGPSYIQGFLKLDERKVTSPKVIDRLRKALIDPESYHSNGSVGCFMPGLGLRFTQGTRQCDVLVCLMCFQVLIAPNGDDEGRVGGNLGPAGNKKLAELYREIIGNVTEGDTVCVRAAPKAGDEDIREAFTDFLTLDWPAALVRLDLSDSKVTDAGLAYVATSANLETLILRDTAVTDLGLLHLHGLLKLKQLDVHGSKVSAAGLKDLQRRLPGLHAKKLADDSLARLTAETQVRGLSISHSAVTDAGLAHIAGLTNLEVLDLSHTQITDAGMAHLAGMKKLQCIDLSDTKVTGPGLRHIEGLAALGQLRARNIVADVMRLRGLHALDELDLGGARIGKLQLEDVKRLSILTFETLSIGELTLKDVPALSQLWFSDMSVPILVEEGTTAVKKACLEGEQVTDAGFAHMAALPHLEKLYISDCSINGSGFASLAGLKHLELLRVSAAPVDAEGLSHLRSWPSLRSLSLSGTQRSARDLPVLAELAQLEELELDNGYMHHHEQPPPPPLTDDDLVVFKKLTKLKNLHLWHTRVSDRGVEHLVTLKHLSTLQLGDTQITDGGLARLKTLPDLDTFGVDSSRITDAGLEHLAGLQRLKWLGLRGSRVTREGVAKLERRLPGCAIHW